MTADTASPHTDVERVLAITAHPDDIDFGAAGTIATLTDGGVEVTYCVCTDGQAGGFDPDGGVLAVQCMRQRGDGGPSLRGILRQPWHLVGLKGDLDQCLLHPAPDGRVGVI